MNFMIDTGNGRIAVGFYMMLVIFGSYFILNLILAVIMGSFTKFENQEREEIIEDTQKEIFKKFQDI